MYHSNEEGCVASVAYGVYIITQHDDVHKKHWCAPTTCTQKVHCLERELIDVVHDLRGAVGAALDLSDRLPITAAETVP